MSLLHPYVVEAIGENIDALITIDLRGYHVGRTLYRAARRASRGPLSTAAAQAMVDAVQPQGTVLLTTGFPFLPYREPELDGIVGTAVLARAIDLGLDARSVVVTDVASEPVVREVLRDAGLYVTDDREALSALPHATMVMPFSTDADTARVQARTVLEMLPPQAAIAIEKPGANENGVYHQGNGADVSDMVAKVDPLFELAREHGVPTIAIGDLGNELGLGALADVLETETAFGHRFVGAPTGSIAATFAADHVIACSVSDWGAYGLAAALSVLTGRAEALHSPTLQRHLLWSAVRAGALDGSGRAEPAVDGVGEDYTSRLVATLRDVAWLTAAQSVRFEAAIKRLELLPGRDGRSGSEVAHE